MNSWRSQHLLHDTLCGMQQQKKPKQFADNLCSAIIKKKTCLSNKGVSHFILLINLFVLPWTSSRVHTGHVTRLCSQLASTINLESPINFFHPCFRTSTGSKLQTERLPSGLKRKMFWLYNNPNHHWSSIFIILTLCIHYIVVSGVSKRLGCCHIHDDLEYLTKTSHRKQKIQSVHTYAQHRHKARVKKQMYRGKKQPKGKIDNFQWKVYGWCSATGILKS